MSVLATDNFNRANANPIGGNWTTITGLSAMQIVSNAATPSSLSPNDCGSYYNAVTWPNDQYSQAKLTVVDTKTDGSGIGVAVRVAAAALTAYRVVLTHASPGTNVSLQRFLAGAFTRLWDRGAAFVDGDLVRLEVQGTTLRVFINGVQVGADFTDTNIASGNAGISYSSVATSASLDDWEGGDFGGGTTSGTATLTGAGTLTDVATLGAIKTSTGAGVLTNAPVVGAGGTLIGGGTLGPLATLGATESSTGAGTLSDTATVRATVPLTGAGLLSDAAVVGAIVSATGAGTLTALSGQSANLVGAGTLTALATIRGPVTFTGAGVLTTAAGPSASSGEVWGVAT